MSSFAIVPVKSLSEAKRRLSHHLTIQERRVLVLAMLEDVLASIQASRAFQKTIVVSPDKIVNSTAGKYNATPILQSGPGLNAGVQQATTTALQQGATSTTNILGDIPFIQPNDITELVGISRESPRVVLCPSLDGGTNIMLRSPPTAILHAYGRWSFTRHLRLAQKNNVHAYALSNPRSSFDIDTIDDLRTVHRLDPEGRTKTGAQVKNFDRLVIPASNA